MTDVTGPGAVLVLQHIRCEPPAVYEDVLLDRGYAVHRVELDEGDQLPPHRDFAALVVMGGPMGAFDDHEHPWLADERRFIADAVAAGLPYWGVCLGAQLLAGALGAGVFRGETPEVGTHPVRLAPGAAADPVFGGLPHEFPVFQWHSDTFDLPEAASLLASSEMYRNQAFAVGSAYGLQFHVEVDTALAQEWARVPAYRNALERLYGAGATDRVLGELAEHADENVRIATTVFEAWLDRYVGGRRQIPCQAGLAE